MYRATQRDYVTVAEWRLQKIPKAFAFGIFLSKPQAWHIITRKRVYHQPFGLYLITRQRVSSCGLMIYKAYRFDDIQFLAELMIYTPSA